MKVLDVGCGPGRVAIPIAREVGPAGEVVAIDMQAAMLRRAGGKAHAAGLANLRFLQTEVGKGNLQIAQFDRALLVTVLGEILDREGALREIFDNLKPGGVLSVTEIMLDPHYQSRGTILRLAKGVGFCESEYFGNRFAFTLNLRKPAAPNQKRQ